MALHVIESETDFLSQIGKMVACNAQHHWFRTGFKFGSFGRGFRIGGLHLARTLLGEIFDVGQFFD